MMHLIEGPSNGFTDIPTSMYWAIVTMTTVGFGDITPHTALGKALAPVLIVLGYGIIAVPTGIVSVELVKSTETDIQKCKACKKANSLDSKFCKRCGKNKISGPTVTFNASNLDKFEHGISRLSVSPLLSSSALGAQGTSFPTKKGRGFPGYAMGPSIE